MHSPAHQPTSPQPPDLTSSHSGAGSGQALGGIQECLWSSGGWWHLFLPWETPPNGTPPQGFVFPQRPGLEAAPGSWPRAALGNTGRRNEPCQLTLPKCARHSGVHRASVLLRNMLESLEPGADLGQADIHHTALPQGLLPPHSPGQRAQGELEGQTGVAEGRSGQDC